jgi:uncharacterized membrane protein YciS (DUF1049 family)
MNTLVILTYVAIMFALGVLTGITIENQHHRKQQLKRAKARHPVGSSIEQQMAKDGWKI